jgi:hypothetical protein
MSPDPSIPPLRDLPPGRLESRHAHLLSEIGRQRRWRLRPPTVTWTSPRVAAVAGASATAAAVIAATVAVTWSGSGPSRRPAAVPPQIAYAFHVSPARSLRYSRVTASSGVTLTDATVPAFRRHRGGRVPIAVYALARYQAAANGDGHPTALRWVKTTRQRAVSSQSGDRVDSPRRPVYFVVLHGRFVDKNAYYLGAAARAPKGTVLSFTIDRRSTQVLDFALGNRNPNYSKLGRPHRLSFGAGRGTK